MLLLVHNDGSAEVVDAATAEALVQAIGNQVEIAEIAPGHARVTDQLGRVLRAALSVADRQEPPATASHLGSRQDGVMDREWVTINEAARALYVSRRTVERRIAAGDLRSRKFGASRRVFALDLTIQEAA